MTESPAGMRSMEVPFILFNKWWGPEIVFFETCSTTFCNIGWHSFSTIIRRTCFSTLNGRWRFVPSTMIILNRRSPSEKEWLIIYLQMWSCNACSISLMTSWLIDCDITVSSSPSIDSELGSSLSRKIYWCGVASFELSIEVRAKGTISIFSFNSSK